MPSAEKILVRGVNWLGDAVMTTPALQRLREARPGARITLVTHEKLADLWQRHPSIDSVVTMCAGEGVFSIGRRLRNERFDVAITLPNSFRSALELFVARIPHRIGHARNGRTLLLTRALPPRAGAVPMHKRSRSEIDRRIARQEARETFPGSAHHVHDYLHLVAALGANPEPVPPLLHVSDEEIAAVRSRFDLSKGVPLFALNAGAEYGSAKRWPAERFVEAAVHLHARVRCHWIILGGAVDRALTDSITSEILKSTGPTAVTNLVGRTSLRELCAVLKASAFLLTNDTGPMHVAAAVGTPVVVLFGSTSPDLTGPSLVAGSPHRLIVGEAPSAPCFLRDCPIDFRCMKSISVEQVVKGVLSAWQARR